MPLLHLVPPAFALVLDHRRLFNKHPRLRAHQLQQRRLRPRHRSVKLPSRKDRCFSGLRRHMRHVIHQLRGRLTAFEHSSCSSTARQPRIDRPEQSLRRRRLRQRQQQYPIDRRARPLGLRIEAAHRLDLIAEKVNANRPLHLGAIDVENSATHRHLPGHLHHVHARVANREQMLHQHLRKMLLTLAQSQRQRSIVVARKELHARSFNGRNHQLRRAARKLPQGRSPLLLNLSMRR